MTPNDANRLDAKFVDNFDLMDHELHLLLEALHSLLQIDYHQLSLTAELCSLAATKSSVGVFHGSAIEQRTKLLIWIAVKYFGIGWSNAGNLQRRGSSLRFDVLSD